MSGKDGNDLGILWGVKAISEEIGRPYDATLRMLKQGLLPASRIGLKWCSDKESLRRHFREKFTVPAGKPADEAGPASSAERA